MSRRLECTFVSHPWTVHALGSLGLGPGPGTTLVEIAPDSMLADACGAELSPDHRGIASLLTPGTRLDALGRVAAGLMAPVVFASSQPMRAARIRAAAALLRDCPFDGKVIHALVNVADFAEYRGIYGMFDRLRIVWDMADDPSDALVQLGEHLATDGLLTDNRWDGFHGCSLPARPIDPARGQAFRVAVERFPGAARPQRAFSDAERRVAGLFDRR